MEMITDHFDAGANRHPDNVCLQSTGLSLTYAEVQANSHAIGHALSQLALSSAHVGVLAPNHPLSFVAMLGALRAGATFIPLNARDSIESLIWFMSFTQLSVLVLHSQYAEHAERIHIENPDWPRPTHRWAEHHRLVP
jgi:acyl-CoA synthetase (AMP-forming)/AMP-acid ligase II